MLHGGRGQVGVFVFELPVQRQASLLTVLVERRGQGVNLTEGGAGRHLVTDTTTRRCQSQCSAKPRPQPTLHIIGIIVLIVETSTQHPHVGFKPA